MKGDRKVAGEACCLSKNTKNSIIYKSDNDEVIMTILHLIK